MAPDKLENGAQCCFNKFDCRLFASKFSQFAFYLCISLSVVSESLAQPCCKCFSLSISFVVNVWYTTNGMCVNNNTHVAQRSRNKMSTTWDLYCCLVPQCEALRTCCSAFPITKSNALTRMWRWCQVQSSHWIESRYHWWPHYIFLFIGHFLILQSILVLLLLCCKDC